MARVTVAKSAGFCFGVKRAVLKAYELADSGAKVYTLGPIIHNENVVKELADKGAMVLNSVEEAELLLNDDTDKKVVVVIRSHGVDRATDEKLKEISEKSGGRISVHDATCPFVKKIHRIVDEASKAGKQIIICGDESHPEVKGIVGWSNSPVYVVACAEDLEKLDFKEINELCMVAQTTFNYKKFQEFVAIIEKRGYDRNTSVVNTICNATEERQNEARELALHSEAMIIIGGSHSSNTRKLYEISKSICDQTYYVQNADELDYDSFSQYNNIGITAGASTPHNIIEEVQNAMEDFEQMLNESFVSIHNGKEVEGTVIDVKEDEIVLNIGYKADGIITRSEYTKDSSLDLTTVVKAGDKLRAKVLKVNDGDGQVSLSCRKVRTEVKESQIVADAFENKTVLTGKVTEVVKGGINVVVDDMKIFIPASLISDPFEKDLTKYQDQDIDLLVIEYNPKKRRVIGDRKSLLVAEKAKKLEEALASIKEGDIFDGTVKNITDFGVFVDIGDVDGLLHVSEMGWGRIENPKKAFKVGDPVRVFVKEIKGSKIALSKKFDEENPWADAEEKYAVGTIVTGKVARMTAFGAFIELADGVDALLHVSQILRTRVEKPSDVLKIGQEIEAKIVDFKPEDKKISLSMKVLAPELPAEEVAEEAPATEE